jgi:hypothetical protein
MLQWPSSSFPGHDGGRSVGLARKVLAQIATRRWAILLMGLGLGASACEEQPPVVAQGRYVEIATERTDEICGGTVTAMDDFLERVFAEIDETPPSGVFVRYDWLEPAVNEDGVPIDSAETARDLGDSTLISANRLLHEHELAHAVHQRAWPESRPFLQEGFAVLFDSRSGFTQSPWPAGDPLDPLLQAGGTLDSSEYYNAWFLVSQIARDHGMEGLRDFWHAVPADASAERARQAYQDLFGRPIDVLLEPYEASEGGPLLERWSCHLTVCGEPQPWDGDTWQADGPFACADDPDALGPMDISGTGIVQRHHVVELEPATSYRFTPAGGVAADLRPCGLQCQPLGASAHSFWPDRPSTRSDLAGGRYRVEILSRFEDLPAEPPGIFTIERLD